MQTPAVKCEYIFTGTAYVLLQAAGKKEGFTVKKPVDHHSIIIHFPEDKAGQRELTRKVALIHAQTISEKLSALSCPAETKVSIIHEVIKKHTETK